MSYLFKHMQKVSKEQIAVLVKTNRKRKNYTQQHLAKLCGISLRSVQRIERAEVSPQQYTIAMLAKHLELAPEDIPAHGVNQTGRNHSLRRIILSCGAGTCIFLLGSAYVFQSPTFPETAFEMALYLAALILIYVIILMRIWR